MGSGRHNRKMWSFLPPPSQTIGTSALRLRVAITSVGIKGGLFSSSESVPTNRISRRCLSHPFVRAASIILFPSGETSGPENDLHGLSKVRMLRKEAFTSRRAISVAISFWILSRFRGFFESLRMESRSENEATTSRKEFRASRPTSASQSSIFLSRSSSSRERVSERLERISSRRFMREPIEKTVGSATTPIRIFRSCPSTLPGDQPVPRKSPRILRMRSPAQKAKATFRRKSRGSPGVSGTRTTSNPRCPVNGSRATGYPMSPPPSSPTGVDEASEPGMPSPSRMSFPSRGDSRRKNPSLGVPGGEIGLYRRRVPRDSRGRMISGQPNPG